MERYDRRKDVLTMEEACRKLRISRKTMTRWLKAKKITSARPGHKHLFTLKEIKRILGKAK